MSIIVKKYGNLKEAMERYGLGRPAIERLAKESCAKSKIGTRVLYNFEKMDKHLDEVSLSE